MFKLFDLGSSAERRHVLPALLLFLAAVLLSLDVAAATTRTWTGAGGDNNWSTAANWGGAAPVAGDDLVFPNGALQLSNNNDLAAGTSFNTISFPGPVGGYTIHGNDIQLVAGLTATNNTANYFHLPILLTASQTFTISGTALWLNEPINLGANTLTFAGPSGLVYLGTVSGTGGISSSVHYLYFFGVNSTYTGPTNITGGNFSLNSSNLSPSSVVTVSGGTLVLMQGATTGPVTVNSGGELRCGNNSVSNVGNVTNLTLQSGSTLWIGAYSTSNYGQLNASGSVNVGGATLSGTFAFTSSPGNAFTIINKTSPGPITGTFAGLPEGATFTANNGRTYRITYKGGDGNDVVVTDPVAWSPATLMLLLD